MSFPSDEAAVRNELRRAGGGREPHHAGSIRRGSDLARDLFVATGLDVRRLSFNLIQMPTTADGQAALASVNGVTGRHRGGHVDTYLGILDQLKSIIQTRGYSVDEAANFLVRALAAVNLGVANGELLPNYTGTGLSEDEVNARNRNWMAALDTKMANPAVDDLVHVMNELAPDGVMNSRTIFAAYTDQQLGRLGGAEPRLLSQFPEVFASVPENLRFGAGWTEEITERLAKLRLLAGAGLGGMAALLEGARRLGYVGDLLSFAITFAEAETLYAQGQTQQSNERWVAFGGDLIGGLAGTALGGFVGSIAGPFGTLAGAVAGGWIMGGFIRDRMVDLYNQPGPFRDSMDAIIAGIRETISSAINAPNQERINNQIPKLLTDVLVSGVPGEVRDENGNVILLVVYDASTDTLSVDAPGTSADTAIEVDLDGVGEAFSNDVMGDGLIANQNLVSAPLVQLASLDATWLPPVQTRTPTDFIVGYTNYGVSFPDDPDGVITVYRGRPVRMIDGRFFDDNNALIPQSEITFRPTFTRAFIHLAHDEEGDALAVQGAEITVVGEAGGSSEIESPVQWISFAELGSTFGSNLSTLLDIEDQWSRLAAGSLLGTIGLNIGQEIDLAGGSYSGPGFSDFPADLWHSGAGAISSVLVAELIESLGLDGTLYGDWLQTHHSAYLTEIILNLPQILNGNFTSLAQVNPVNLLGSFLGAQLAAKIVDFDTVGGQIGSSIGSAIGAAVAMKAFGDVAGLIGNLLIPGIGAFIGFIVGGLIGSLIQGTPKAGAVLGWSAQDQQFEVGRVWSKNGGSKDAVRSMALQVGELLNNVVAASGANIADATGIQTGVYEQKGKKFIYKASDATGFALYSKDMQQVVLHGAYIALSDLSERLIGGDVYIKRALSATLHHANGMPGSSGAFAAGDFEVETLFGNITVARDYRRYVDNPVPVHAILGGTPDSAMAATWNITLAHAAELGLDRRWKSDWLGGWAAFLDETPDGKLNGASLSVSSLLLEFDPYSTERLFSVFDATGAYLATFGDTIDTDSKTIIDGTDQADEIELVHGAWTETALAPRTHVDPETGQPVTEEVEVNVGVTGWRIVDASGLSIDGEALVTGSSGHIRVTAYIDGGAGDDVIKGGDLGNDLLGGAGNDTLVGGVLDDWQFGGAGNDRLFAGNANTNFSDTDATSETARRLAVGEADAAGNYIDGGNGDYLDGGEGDDFVYGGRGSDWLNGGAGVDRLIGGDGGDILDGGAGDDRGANGEAMLFGGAGSDQYVFYYGAGNDVIFDSGNATAVAGAGLYSANSHYAFLGQNPGARNWAGGGDYEVDGSVVGGEDAISFGPGIGFEDISLQRGMTNGVANSDLIIELTALNENGVRVATGDTLTIRDWFDDTRKVEWLRFADGQDIRIGDISSIIIGPNVGDSIIGTNGNDWAVGTTDDDDFHLLNGDDFGFGGKGDDFVGGDGDNDFLSGGDGDDVVSGGAGHDTVFGDAGSDLVEGGAGNDIVVGGRGDDRMVGGAGNDLYRFSRGDGRDVVLDDYAANTTTEIIFDPGDYVNDYERAQDWRALRAGMDGVIDTNFWNLPLMWDPVSGTLRERTGSLTVSNAGLDTFEFGYGIDIEDIQLARMGDDLVMAITGAGDGASAFMDIADRITFEDWIAVPGQIERFSFVETGLLDITSWYLGAAATDGDDTINGDVGGTPKKDWLTGGLGDDVISGGGEDDILSGNFGADVISGGAGADVIYGGGDNDVIDGGAGADFISGGSGEDIASYASNTNQYSGVHVSLANSSLNTLDAAGDVFVGIEGLEGSSKNDELWGDQGDNVLRGLGGNDVLKGDFGHDTYEVNAGEGNDIISDRGITIEEVIDAAGNLMPGYEVDWTLIDSSDGEDPEAPRWSCYQLTLTATGGGIVYQSIPYQDFIYDTIAGHHNPPPASAWPFGPGRWVSGGRTGNGFQTVIEGTAAGDGGYDTLAVGAGVSLADITVEANNNGADLKLTFRNQAGAANGSVTIQNHFAVYGSENTRDRAIEELLLADGLSANLANLAFGASGTAEDDLFLGGAGNDTFSGGDGDDVISGGSGNDTLSGGAGNDTFEGGAGADSFSGGADSVTNDHAARQGNGLAAYGDTIRYVGSAAVNIDLQAGTASGGDATGDEFTGIENVVGSSVGADVLKGDDWHNQLVGLGGVDLLEGRGGDDLLIGGDGDDIISGGDGHDGITGDAGADDIDGGAGDDVISAGDGNDAVDGGAGKDRIDGGAGADVIYAGADDDEVRGGDGDDVIYGDGGNDVLIGEAGADQIHGGDGDDTIAGGAGNDFLYGAAGDDAYVFDAESGVDQIVDASGGKNSIAFNGVSFDKIWLTKVGLDLKITLIGSDTIVIVKDYYAATSATLMRSISAGERVIYLAHAEALITAMTAAGLSAPEALPQEISALHATYWELGPRAAPRVANQALSLTEDTSLSGSVGAIDPDDQVISYEVHQGPSHGTLIFTAATGVWTYQPDANWHGADYFEVAVTDADNQTSIERVDLTVTPVNDAPTIAAPTLSVAENAASGAVVGSLSATDIEGQAVAFTQQTNAGGRFAVSASGEITVIDGALLNFESASSYQISVTATDAGGASTNQTVTISVTDVNEAPTALAFTNAVTSIAENTSTGTAIKVADLAVTDDALGSESFTLTGADAALFEVVGGALYLRSGVALNYETKASYSVTVNVDDATVGATPDASQTFTLNVTDVNEAPTALSFTNVTASLSDTTSTTSRIHVADLIVTDDALGSETLAVTGADAASFEIFNGALYLRQGVTLNAATQSNYSVSVTIDDPTLGAGVELTEAFSLSVGAGLSLALANTTTSIAENTSTAAAIKVADLVVADDVGTPTITLTGADAASFEIIGGALYLRAGVGLNFETKANYDVTVVMDEPLVGSGADLTRNFTLNVSNVNEAPTALAFANTVTSLAENTSTATRIKVADLNITDDALGAETIGLTGADAASFEIFNGALYLRAGVALNCETKSSYAVTVTVDDTTVGGTPDLSQAFTLTITDVNEAPTALAFANTVTSLAENTSTATRIKVADLNITDDALGAETIGLTGADAASFEIFNGALYLKAGVVLNYEAKTSYAVTVTVDDNTVGGTPDLSQAFTLTVTNVNEAPTALAFANTTTNLAENTSTATRIKVADLNVTDDALGSETLSLSGSDAASFEIISGVLYLKAGVALNFEAKPSYSVTVNVDDTTVGSTPDVSQTFTLTLTDVNEAPALNWTGSSAQAAGVTWNGTTHAFAVPETLATGVTLGLLATTDPDSGAFANLRYELTGANASRFAVNAATGAISLVNALNYEASPNTWSVGVTVWDGGAIGAGLSSSGTITISTTDVNEAPAGSGFWYYYAGNVAANTTVGTVSATDPEGSSITYSIYSVSRDVTHDGETTTTSLATSSYSITTGGLVKVAAGASVVNGGLRNDTVTIKVTDAQGNFSYITATATYDRSAGGGGGGGGGSMPPIVIDLNGDGITLTPFAESTISMDVTGDGLVDPIGWIGADDGFLALDRNGDGVIAGIDEIMFSRDATGAATDFEGLRAYDTNENGFIDVGDAQFGELRVWQDANSDGVAQAGEVTTLADRQISNINLTLTPTGQNPIGASDNVLYATASYTRTDGTVGIVGDVFLHYVPTIMQSGGLPPIVFDLDGGGIALTSRLRSTVRFDADDDGVTERTGWFGAGEGVLALDRNGDGLIGSGAEISFAQDFAGAVTDLEGLQAFDSNQNGFFDTGDARFGEFVIWRDANQDGVSQADELRSLAEWNIQAVNLTPVLTGASLIGADDNVLYATSVFVRTDGSRGTIGDVYLSFDESAPTLPGEVAPLADVPVTTTPDADWCGTPDKYPMAPPTPVDESDVSEAEDLGAPILRPRDIRHNVPPVTAEHDWSVLDGLWRGRRPRQTPVATDTLATDRCLTGAEKPAAPAAEVPWCATDPDKTVAPPPSSDEDDVVRTADNPRRPRSTASRPGARPFDWIDRHQVAYGDEFADRLAEPARQFWRPQRDAKPVEADDQLAAAAAEAPRAAAALALAGVTGAPRSTLHSGLALADKRVLHMVNAMASFDAQPASDLARTGRQRDPRVAAMLTSLPDLR